LPATVDRIVHIGVRCAAKQEWQGRAVSDLSDKAVRDALQQTYGIQKLAAQLLRVSTRTLRRRMKESGIRYEESRGPHALEAARLEQYLAVVPQCGPLTSKRKLHGEWASSRPGPPRRATAEEISLFFHRPDPAVRKD
jgi:hypothetical protein